MGDEGFEFPEKTTEKRTVSQVRSAESGARGARSAESADAKSNSGAVGACTAATVATDPELARLAEVWAKLPEANRRGILAMVEAAAGTANAREDRMTSAAEKSERGRRGGYRPPPTG